MARRSKKQFVYSARVYGKSRPEAGERALLAAIGMLVQSESLRTGDWLAVRIPIRGEDIPANEPDAAGAQVENYRASHKAKSHAGFYSRPHRDPRHFPMFIAQNSYRAVRKCIIDGHF
jgi:hypothetical protein